MNAPATMPSALPVATLGRRYHFSASHRLHAAALSDDVNRDVYGKCNNPHGHGHNYVIEVAFCGPVHANWGMVLDLAALDAFAQAELLDVYDCANLNCLAAFRDQVPSTEYLAVAMHALFSRFRDARFPLATLAGVHVDETGNNSFDYAGEGNPPAGTM